MIIHVHNGKLLIDIDVEQDIGLTESYCQALVATGELLFACKALAIAEVHRLAEAHSRSFKQLSVFESAQVDLQFQIHLLNPSTVSQFLDHSEMPLATLDLRVPSARPPVNDFAIVMPRQGMCGYSFWIILGQGLVDDFSNNTDQQQHNGSFSPVGWGGL